MKAPYDIGLALQRGFYGALSAAIPALSKALIQGQKLDWGVTLGYALAGFLAGLAVDYHAFSQGAASNP